MRRLWIGGAFALLVGCGRVEDELGASAIAHGDAGPDVTTGADSTAVPSDAAHDIGDDVSDVALEATVDAAPADPDERSVAWIRNGGKLLHRCELPSESCTLIESLGFVHWFALSRDRRTLVAAAEREIRGRIDLLVSDGRGENLRVVFRPPQMGGADSYAMSPDGAKVLFKLRDEKGLRLIALTLATGERHEIFYPRDPFGSPEIQPLSAHAWSLHGRAFAFVACTSSECRLHVVDTAATLPTHSTAPVRVYPSARLAWTVDDRLVFVGSSHEYPYTSTLLSWDGVAPPVVETPEARAIGAMAVSADGTMLAYSMRATDAAGFELYLRSTAVGASPVRLTAGDLAKDDGPYLGTALAISSDDEKVAFLGRNGEKRGAFVATTKPVPSTRWLSEADALPWLGDEVLAWSPSSKQIAFFRGGYETRVVRVSDVAAAEPASVPAFGEVGESAFDVRWTGALPPHPETGDAGAGDAVPVDVGPASDASGDALVAPEGPRLWFRMDRQWRNNFELRLHSLGSGGESTGSSPLGETTEVDSLAVARDGSMLVVAAELEQPLRFHLYALHADGSGVVKLHDGTYHPGAFEHLAISPDAKRVAFCLGGTGWIAGTDGSSKHAIGAGCGPYAWSPDSTKLAYAHGDPVKDLYVVDATSAAPTPVSVVPPSWGGLGHAGVVRPRWTSPNTVIVSALRKGDGVMRLHRFALDGSSIDLGFSAEDDRVDVSRDGRLLLFDDRDALWVAPTDGSRPPERRLDGDFYYDDAPCVFSPDASRIACVQRVPDSLRAVVVVPTVSGPAVVLHRQYPVIDRLAFAPDGASLAFSTGATSYPGTVLRLADLTTPDQVPIVVQPIADARVLDLHFVP